MSTRGLDTAPDDDEAPRPGGCDACHAHHSTVHVDGVRLQRVDHQADCPTETEWRSYK